MANLSEIEAALNILLENGCNDITILHCSSVYPTKYYNSNLNFINTMRKEFDKKDTDVNIKYGWSDHTVDESVIYRSVHKFDCEFVEFHLDLDKKGAEFDSGHCWLPSQMKHVISNISKSISSDGSDIKKMIDFEISERDWRADSLDGLRPIKSFRGKL